MSYNMQKIHCLIKLTANTVRKHSDITVSNSLVSANLGEICLSESYFSDRHQS